MDYIIGINTILTILICLTNADEDINVCKEGLECMDLIEDKQLECVQQVQYLLDQTNDDSQVEFCNTGKTKVCCTPPYIPETISERSEFVTITSFVNTQKTNLKYLYESYFRMLGVGKY